MKKIENDPSFSLSQKAEKMIAIFNKSKEKNINADGKVSTPKYAAATYLINYIQKNISSCNESEKSIIM